MTYKFSVLAPNVEGCVYIMTNFLLLISLFLLVPEPKLMATIHS